MIIGFCLCVNMRAKLRNFMQFQSFQINIFISVDQCRGCLLYFHGTKKGHGAIGKTEFIGKYGFI
jgi:hypothetical protein